MEYVVERVKNCDDPAGAEVRRGRLPGFDAQVRLLTADHAKSKFLFQNVVDQYCFNAVNDAGLSQSPHPFLAFALIPVKDLTMGEHRRLSLVKIDIHSAEISFD